MAPTRFRYFLVTALAVSMVVAFLERSAISVLIVDREFLATMGLTGDPARQGLLVTAFLVTYGIANVALGSVIDRLGARRTTLLMIGGWTFFSLFAGAISSYALLLIARIGRGVSEAPQFPLMARYVKNWFPPRERGTANAIWLGGPGISSAIGAPLAVFMITNFGWRSSLFLAAVLGLLLAGPLIWVFAADTPQQSRWVNRAELAHIQAGTGSELPRGKTGQSQAAALFTDPHYWLVVVFHVANLATYWGIFTWMPKYLVEARGFDLGLAGSITGLGYLTSSFATLGAGMLSDRFKRRAPLPFAGVGLLGVFVILAASVPQRELSALFLGLVVILGSLVTPNLYTLLQRIIPSPLISTGVGVDNGIANLGSALAPATVGWLIAATGSYHAGLFALAGVCFVGAGAMGILALKRY